MVFRIEFRTNGVSLGLPVVVIERVHGKWLHRMCFLHFAMDYLRKETGSLTPQRPHCMQEPCSFLEDSRATAGRFLPGSRGEGARITQWDWDWIGIGRAGAEQGRAHGRGHKRAHTRGHVGCAHGRGRQRDTFNFGFRAGLRHTWHGRGAHGTCEPCVAAAAGGRPGRTPARRRSPRLWSGQCA